MANDVEKNGVDDALDALFSDAKAEQPHADLVARVLADATQVQEEIAVAAAPPRRAGLLSRPPSWVAALGGWGGFGGVTAAGIVGLALGFWSPDMVDALSGGQIWSLTDSGLSPDLSELAMELGDV